MRDKDTISIIIPVYNTQKYLRRCLDSVLCQTFNNWRAICVNDGSSDNSGRILDEYAARDKRFVVIHKKNAGVSSARNDALTHVNTEYVMFVDSDDCIHPQMLEILYHFATKYDVDIVSARYDKNVRTDKTITYNVSKIKCKKTDDLINYITEKNHSVGRWKIRHCYPVVHLYRRKLLTRIRFNSDIKISEDFPFLTAVLLRNPRGVVLRTPLYFYIPNALSATGAADNIKIFDNISRAVTESFKLVVSKKTSDKWYKKWQCELLWPFIINFMRSARKVSDTKFVKRRLIKMREMGVFDAPPTTRARKYVQRIEQIING